MVAQRTQTFKRTMGSDDILGARDPTTPGGPPFVSMSSVDPPSRRREDDKASPRDKREPDSKPSKHSRRRWGCRGAVAPILVASLLHLRVPVPQVPLVVILFLQQFILVIILLRPWPEPQQEPGQEPRSGPETQALQTGLQGQGQGPEEALQEEKTQIQVQEGQQGRQGTRASWFGGIAGGSAPIVRMAHRPSCAQSHGGVSDSDDGVGPTVVRSVISGHVIQRKVTPCAPSPRLRCPVSSCSVCVCACVHTRVPPWRACVSPCACCPCAVMCCVLCVLPSDFPSPPCARALLCGAQVEKTKYDAIEAEKRRALLKYYNAT